MPAHRLAQLPAALPRWERSATEGCGFVARGLGEFDRRAKLPKLVPAPLALCCVDCGEQIALGMLDLDQSLKTGRSHLGVIHAFGRMNTQVLRLKGYPLGIK